MTRPTNLPNALGVADDVAFYLTPPLLKWLAEARRDHVQLHGDIVETVEKLDLHGQSWRNEMMQLPRARQSPSVPPSDNACTDRRDWLRSREAATVLGVTPRRVLALVYAGRLDAEQLPDKTWRISPPSIEARKESLHVRTK
jgi:hypothetical protein